MTTMKQQTTRAAKSLPQHVNGLPAPVPPQPAQSMTEFAAANFNFAAQVNNELHLLRQRLFGDANDSERSSPLLDQPLLALTQSVHIELGESLDQLKAICARL